MIAGKSFSGPDLRNLAHCLSLILRAVRQLQDDLSLAHYDTTIVVSSPGNPPQFNDDPAQIDFQNNLYFGWKKHDAVRDTLIRFNSYLERVIDRVNSRWHGRGFSMNIGFVGKSNLDYDFEQAFPNSGSGRKAAQATCSSDEVDLQTVENDILAKLCSQTFSSEVSSMLKVTEQTLETVMEDQGLTEPFAAVLETYFIPFSTAGSNSVPSALTAINAKNQTFAAGFLSFESDHFRTQNIPFSSLSFGGRIGINPRETVVALNNSDGTPGAKPLAYLQNAFNWQLDTRGNFSVGRRSEVALLFSWGQNILISDTSAVGPAPTNTTSLYGGNTQSGAWFWESGLGYRIYPFDNQRVRDEKKFLLPSFSFSSGFRRDSRFSGLEQAQFGSFLNPEQRWFLRSFVTLTNVIERNPSGNGNSGLFNVGIGFDYETKWGFSGGSVGGRLAVPASSRIYLNASIDLVGAFGKQGAK